MKNTLEGKAKDLSTLHTQVKALDLTKDTPRVKEHKAQLNTFAKRFTDIQNELNKPI